MGKILCGVDLGGTKINTGLLDEYGNIITSIKVPTEAEKGADYVVKKIINSIEFVLKDSGISQRDIAGIGIGSPGPIDAQRGIIIKSSNLPGWLNVEITKEINRAFNTEVKLNNDANAAALGEYMFGSGKGTRNFVYITVSTGIGGGFIVDGKLYDGANSNSAEIGHTVINFDGPRCNCGSFGCFEAYASGTAIGKIAKEELQNNSDSLISEIAGEDGIRAEHVFEAAKKGDKLAIKIIDNEAYYLGIGIANIVNSMNPEVIAIGGGVSNGWDMFSEKMLETARERSIASSFEACKILKAELGENIGLLGAAALINK